MTVLIIALGCVYPLMQWVTFILLLVRSQFPKRMLSAAEKVVYSIALIWLPTVMLLLANVALGSAWKGAKGLGWFGAINEGWAGAAIMPIWLIACLFLQTCLIDHRRFFTSKTNLVMMMTLAAVCLWRASAAFLFDFGEPAVFLRGVLRGDLDAMVGGVYIVSFPLAPFVNLVLLMVRAWRGERLSGRVWPFSLAWVTGLAVTIWAKCVLAMRHYEQLPDEPPSCFIVTAAAHGHARFVGSTPNAASGRMENQQLRRMRALEAHIKGRRPRAHRLLRRVYNVIGPAVAGRMRSRLVCDALYLALKPLELLAHCCPPWHDH